MDREMKRELIRRGHSIRNFDPEEFRDLVDEYEHIPEGKAEARKALKFVESGRFYPMLQAAHKFFRHLDPDEQRDFARRNPGLIEWVNLYGYLEDLIQWKKYVNDGQQQLEG